LDSPTEAHQQLDALGFAWRVAATLFFVLLNGFFVAAEFGLVKVRHSFIHGQAREGKAAGRAAARILARLDHYLSACQLGITMASLALGALGEPAVMALLLAGAGAAGVYVNPDSALFHAFAFALAFFFITLLHMTLGEQAPKIWALQRPEVSTMRSSVPLFWFSRTFTPFIALVNRISNWMVRMVGIDTPNLEEGTQTAAELRESIIASARAGHISEPQWEIAERVLELRELEARHILVPRSDVAMLSLQNTFDQNLEVVEQTRHSRFPLCEADFDSVVGVVHTKDFLPYLRSGEAIDLRKVARPPVIVPETQRVSLVMRTLQEKKRHMALAVDERGTNTGLVFLEDAVERIVGPIQDEFDDEAPQALKLGPGQHLVNGQLSLPEAISLLDLSLPDADEDTIGGHVVARLERLPEVNEELVIGQYRVTVEQVSDRRIELLRFERSDHPLAPPESETERNH
jgi:CBS domain containing-hemolysin-like protein